jgi:hypothetical protein
MTRYVVIAKRANLDKPQLIHLGECQDAAAATIMLADRHRIWLLAMNTEGVVICPAKDRETHIAMFALLDER